jgi:ribosomal protein S18 acetylase RimI-like enzyme
LDVIVEPVAENPDTAARDLILALLDADNSRKSGRQERSDFAVLLRDSLTREVIGGLWAIDDFGWAFITYLYVPSELRGQRIGERLMTEAETIARERGMVGLWVNTFDFQAPQFYRKLGYSVFGELEAGDQAAGQIFLRKRLRQP